MRRFSRFGVTNTLHVVISENIQRGGLPSAEPLVALCSAGSGPKCLPRPARARLTRPALTADECQGRPSASRVGRRAGDLTRPVAVSEGRRTPSALGREMRARLACYRLTQRAATTREAPHPTPPGDC